MGWHIKGNIADVIGYGFDGLVEFFEILLSAAYKLLRWLITRVCRVCQIDLGIRPDQITQGGNMKNYISINDQIIALTDEQVEKLRYSFNMPCVKLADVPEGETFKVGNHEMVVLEHSGDTTAVILKDLLSDQKFGNNNNYAGSNVDKTCSKFAEKVEAIVGKDNLCLHTVDLIADDGLKCYGSVKRKASLLTTEKYRRYVYILDKYKPVDWWWLATAFSTSVHDYVSAVKCVAPSGCVYGSYYCYGVDFGVRPFCILKSHIFVSK